MIQAIPKHEITFSHLIKKAVEAQLKTIGKNLRRLRKERNERIEVVADAVSVSRAQLSSIERGAIDMRVTVLLDLCDYYETELEAVVK